MTTRATLDDAPELEPGTEFRFLEEYEEHLLQVENDRWWLYSFSGGRATHLPPPPLGHHDAAVRAELDGD